MARNGKFEPPFLILVFLPARADSVVFDNGCMLCFSWTTGCNKFTGSTARRHFFGFPIDKEVFLMTTLNAELYDALVEAGTGETNARAAASSVPPASELATKTDFSQMKNEFAQLKNEIAQMEARLMQSMLQMGRRVCTVVVCAVGVSIAIIAYLN